MPLSPLPQSQRPWSISVQNAYQKLYQIYQTGSSYIDIGNVEAHRLQQYGNMIIFDAYPLVVLLTESAEAELIPLQWIEQVATEFTALLELIEEQWSSVKDEYVSSMSARFNLNEMVPDQILSSLFLGIFIRNTLGNVANRKNMLIPTFSMRLSRKEGESLPQSLQAFWG
jgi:hypothetical protein